MENTYTKNFCNKSSSDVFCILMHVMPEAELFPNLMTYKSEPKKQNILFQNFNSQILRLQFRRNCSCFCPMFFEVIQNFTVPPCLTMNFSGELQHRALSQNNWCTLSHIKIHLTDSTNYDDSHQMCSFHKCNKTGVLIHNTPVSLFLLFSNSQI